jgi:hypothetical protein
VPHIYLFVAGVSLFGIGVAADGLLAKWPTLHNIVVWFCILAGFVLLILSGWSGQL